ncbi:Mitochondrial fission ELM1-like [Plasmopara halstedii]|uniref:Mitochondrial fission ELM1-like n=1 Tax=Plasmopara halstedii TaxID=4781 RepID=A0A0P1B0T3_PLAHL|nr:Mitochondrial fission ELM1-like [Plasmopara halstedii]CEG48286.1 Mitochondrial fission ELM1-like [Plasmopara halstedii]|eukprot:XP_024584655.1 Mitochondrial fission ELM1-like [Plasmopara halstedii]
MVQLIVLCNGAAGAEKQALALGARLHRKLRDKNVMNLSSVQCVRITLTQSLLIPPLLQVLGARLTRNPYFGYIRQDLERYFSEQIKTKDLNVLIGCGRSTVALSAVLKQLEPTKIFNVQIQHPRVSLQWFDTVVAPKHDFPRGVGRKDHVFLTSGTIHDITPELLRQQSCEWKEELDKKLQGRQTRVVWLVGGPCRGFLFTEQDAKKMVEEFTQAFPHCDDVAVLLTFSRRTPLTVQKILHQELIARYPMTGQVFVVQGTERQNPYYALLATASYIVTTPDSISMTTEAIAAGKPVFTIGMEMCKGKFLRFHQALFDSRATSPLTPNATRLTLLRAGHDDTSSRASVALENEICSIADTIASAIYRQRKNAI